MAAHRRKQEKTHHSIPKVHLSFNDISVIESALMGYLSYLRGVVPPSPTRNTRIHLLQGLRSRLTHMIQNGPTASVEPIHLTATEIAALHEALAGFAQLIPKVVPPSPERDETLHTFDRLRRHLALKLHSHPSE